MRRPPECWPHRSHLPPSAFPSVRLMRTALRRFDGSFFRLENLDGKTVDEQLLMQWASPPGVRELMSLVRPAGPEPRLPPCCATVLHAFAERIPCRQLADVAELSEARENAVAAVGGFDVKSVASLKAEVKELKAKAEAEAEELKAKARELEQTKRELELEKAKAQEEKAKRQAAENALEALGVEVE